MLVAGCEGRAVFFNYIDDRLHGMHACCQGSEGVSVKKGGEWPGVEGWMICMSGEDDVLYRSGIVP